MSGDDEPKVLTISPDNIKYHKIKQDQKHNKRKQKLMVTELTSISPTSMLANALSIAATELARMSRASQAGELVFNDFRKYAILINSMVKIAEESRLSKQQSQFEGLSDEEIKAKVKEALEIVAEDE